MDYEPTDYSKVAIREYPARTIRETAEGRYWKQFKAPVLAQQASGPTAAWPNTQTSFGFEVKAAC